MAYIVPLYGALHVLEASTVTCTPAASASFPLFYLFDRRGGSLFAFGSSGASSRIDVDRGAAGLEVFDRLFIPSGHNLGAQTVTVKTSTTGAFAGEEVTRASFTSAPGLIDQAVTSNSDRFVRITFAGTGTWQLGELWLTHRLSTGARGPDPRWNDVKRGQYDRTVYRSGVTSTAILGPARRVLGYSFNRLPDGAEGATLKAFLDAIAWGAVRFLLWPIDGSSPLMAELDSQATRQQDSPNPQASGITWQVALPMVEALG